MKKLIIPTVFPLALLLYLFTSKWWYVSIVDWDDKVFYGFPFPNVRPGANSMSLVFFVMETIANYATYFLISFAIIYLYNRLVKQILGNKVTKLIAYIFMLGYLSFSIQHYQAFDGRFVLKNDMQIEVLDSGYEFGLFHTKEFNGDYRYELQKEKIVGNWKPVSFVHDWYPNKVTKIDVDYTIKLEKDRTFKLSQQPKKFESDVNFKQNLHFYNVIKRDSLILSEKQSSSNVFRCKIQVLKCGNELKITSFDDCGFLQTITYQRVN